MEKTLETNKMDYSPDDLFTKSKKQVTAFLFKLINLIITLWMQAFAMFSVVWV